MSGIPFLAPWANRLDETAFYANGKKYSFSLELGNVRAGQNNHPMHGFPRQPASGRLSRPKQMSMLPGLPASLTSSASRIGWRSFGSPIRLK